MNKLIILYILFASFSLKAQSFYFNTNEFTLVKSTSQSPAHWYIEIQTNESVDVPLRWKTFFTNIPQEWVIDFDDQTQSHTGIVSGDSADFILQSNLDMPQKLIIGAHLNNTPGNGTVSFEIYNPANLIEKDTIHFHFKVHQLEAGLEALKNEGVCNLMNGKVYITNDLPSNLTVFSEDGTEVIALPDFYEFDLSTLQSNKLYFFIISQSKHQYFFKIKKST